MRNMANNIFSDEPKTAVSSADVNRSALSFVCLPQLVGAPVLSHLYALHSFVFYFMLSEVPTHYFSFICWKFSVY